MQSPQRKHRFPVHWPLQYRPVNEADWRPGRTVNMSVSGVLFEAAEPLTANENVELSIMFQAPGRGVTSTFVRTGGHVVRSELKVPARIAVKFSPAS
jgi:hypothetical protein